MDGEQHARPLLRQLHRSLPALRGPPVERGEHRRRARPTAPGHHHPGGDSRLDGAGHHGLPDGGAEIKLESPTVPPSRPTAAPVARSTLSNSH